MKALSRIVLLLAATLWVMAPSSALACATCFGAPDAPMTKGLNMGILVLLICVLFVLGLFGTFFVYLAKRAGDHGAVDLKDGECEVEIPNRK